MIYASEATENTPANTLQTEISERVVLVDDSSAVRQALAETLAAMPDAPRDAVLCLADSDDDRLLQLARDEAIVRNQPIAFEADDYRYRFLIRQEDKWQALTDDPMWREREFGRSPVQLSLSPAASQRLPVRISFGREPVDKAFVLTLTLTGQRISVQADGLGNFQVQ